MQGGHEALAFFWVKYLTAETDRMQAEQSEQMTKEELIEKVNLLTDRLRRVERLYEQATAERAKLQTRVERLWRLSLFGDEPGLPRQVYRITYSDAIDAGVMLYVGTLDFTVKSVIGADGRIRRLKPGHMKKFHIEVGWDESLGHLRALNMTELPPHPNIGNYICLGDLTIPGLSKGNRLTESEMEAIWTENKESIISALSTANIMGGFHNDYVTAVYEQPGIYEDDGNGTSSDTSPVWAACSVCQRTDDICIDCGMCRDTHCMGVVCGACGELFHDGICGDCGRCDDCGHADYCEYNEFACESCGSHESIEVCGLCTDCHNNGGHGTCEGCGSHLDSDEYLGDCGCCEECCNGAGHTLCPGCSEHLSADQGMECESCGARMCTGCFERNGVVHYGLAICRNCNANNIWHS